MRFSLEGARGVYMSSKMEVTLGANPGPFVDKGENSTSFNATGLAPIAANVSITATATELMAYCRTLGVPFGINVDSVSIRRVEIEAAVQLAQELRTQLKR